MSASRIAVGFATLGLVLGLTAPARPNGGIVNGKAINKLTVPFSGVVAGPTENVAVTGNVLVKTIHKPGFPDKMVLNAYKVAPGGTGVGQTSGQPYNLKGSAKFKYFIPGAAFPTQISQTSPFMRLCPGSSLCPTGPVLTPGSPCRITLNYDGSGLVTSAVASIEAPPALGSCTQVVEVCN